MLTARKWTLQHWLKVKPEHFQMCMETKLFEETLILSLEVREGVSLELLKDMNYVPVGLFMKYYKFSKRKSIISSWQGALFFFFFGA